MLLEVQLQEARHHGLRLEAQRHRVREARAAVHQGVPTAKAARARAQAVHLHLEALQHLQGVPEQLRSHSDDRDILAGKTQTQKK